MCWVDPGKAKKILDHVGLGVAQSNLYLFNLFPDTFNRDIP
jgi:hypothetical protein